jgi:hypothetical protein
LISYGRQLSLAREIIHIRHIKRLRFIFSLNALMVL